VTDHLSFRLSDEFVEKYQDRPINWGFPIGGGNTLGEITYLTKYSLRRPDGSKERWHECCRRVVEGVYSILKNECANNRTPWNHVKAQRAAEDMFERMFTFKWLPPGRGLFKMGTPFVFEEGSASLQNCAFLSTERLGPRNPTLPFIRMMEMSMLGIGVGFDTLGAGKLTVSEPLRQPPVLHIVADTREGWCASVEALLLSYFTPNQAPVEFDYSLVRPAGTPIIRFGGIAAGPMHLENLHESLRKLLKSQLGQEITSTTIVDVMNLIGKCVVSGNVRRSAQIAFGDTDDDEFLQLKDWNLNPERMGPDGWGGLSNNSVVASVGDNLSKLIPGIVLNGEPGIFYRDLARSHGRLEDPRTDKDFRVAGANPCVTGDTLIAVADGRGAVSIKQLAEDGVDVPVYAADDEGRPVVRMGYRPRLTWQNANVYEVLFDDGTSYRVTDEHPFLLRDGRYVPAIELQPGDSVRPFSRWAARPQGKSGWYWFVNAGNGPRSNRMEHRLIDQFVGADCEVVHHADNNGLNNSWDNLIPLTKKQHDSLHRATMLGDNNPARRCMTQQWRDNLATASHRDRNARFGIALSKQTRKKMGRQRPMAFLGHEHSAEVKRLLSLSRSMSREQKLTVGLDVYRDLQFTLGRLPTSKEWSAECHSRGLPAAKFGMPFSEYRKLAAEHNHRVVSVTPVGRDDVYNISVEEFHNYAIVKSTIDSNGHEKLSGIYTHNCVEQSLEDGELCTLVETFPYHHESLEDYKRTLKSAYLYGKCVTLLPTHWPESNEVMNRNHRIGLSMSGIVQFVEDRGVAELRRWCDEGYAEVHRRDVQYSEWLGIRESIKSTSVKPSGTVSLLVGATPGVHWPPGGGTGDTYIRRQRFSMNDPLVPLLRKAGYHVEPDVQNPNADVVVEFPTRGPKVRSEREVSVWEKVALAQLMSEVWADNMVSATFSFTPDEESQVGPVVAMSQGKLKSMSFLPLGPASSKGAYPQMPYEGMTTDEYTAACSTKSRLNTKAMYSNGAEAQGERFCSNDTCELR
jgi:hypothetical protein